MYTGHQINVLLKAAGHAGGGLILPSPQRRSPTRQYLCAEVLVALGRRNQTARLGKSLSGSSPASFRQSRRCTLCHPTVSTPKPEGAARCVSSARRDWCGRREEILVPAAATNACWHLTTTASIDCADLSAVSARDRRLQLTNWDKSSSVLWELLHAVVWKFTISFCDKRHPISGCHPIAASAHAL
jgi:hypothetical protein